jgi:hypothetical protein
MEGDCSVYAPLICWRHRRYSHRLLTCTTLGDTRSGSPRLDDGSPTMSLSLMGASFWSTCWMEEANNGVAVHLPRRQWRVLVAWRNGVSGINMSWWAHAGWGAVTQHTTIWCSAQVIDITLTKTLFRNYYIAQRYTISHICHYKPKVHKIFEIILCPIMIHVWN